MVHKSRHLNTHLTLFAVDQYFWIQNNYANATVLTIEHFGEKLERIRELNINPKKEIH